MASLQHSINVKNNTTHFKAVKGMVYFDIKIPTYPTNEYARDDPFIPE
jgi:hypothetical protein